MLLYVDVLTMYGVGSKISNVRFAERRNNFRQAFLCRAFQAFSGALYVR